MSEKLLIPGTGGNKLVLEGEDVGWPALLFLQSLLAGKSMQWLGGSDFFQGFPSAQQIVQMLSMEYKTPNDPNNQESWKPSQTTLLDGEIKPAEVIWAPYNQFKDYDVFPYDWRADIRESGRLLLQRLKQDAPQKGRRKLVGHSQGGLVIVAASKLCAIENGGQDTAFSKLVSHVIFLGCPLYGTLNALEALINGNQLSPGFSEHFIKIALTWPALYQMFPFWHNCVDGIQSPDALLQPANWEGLTPSIDLDHLSRARDLRFDFLDGPIADMANIKVRIAMSQALRTWNQTQKGAQFWTLPPLDQATGLGDGLVPSDITRKMMGDSIEADRLRLFGAPGSQRIQEHMMLGVNPTISSWIAECLASGGN